VGSARQIADREEVAVKLPRIIHLVPRYDITDENALTRCRRAWESWSWLYNAAHVVPAHIWEIKRDSRSIGDSRILPFLVDVFANGYP